MKKLNKLTVCLLAVVLFIGTFLFSAKTKTELNSLTFIEIPFGL